MLVVSLCTHIILNARRYFHKCLNIPNPILYDSYHTSPLIQEALSVRALNRGMGLNLFKFASFSALTPVTFFFFFHTPAQRRILVREASNWKTSIVLAAEHSGSLGSVWGDWTSWALPWKTSGWRCWMGARVWKDGGRGGEWMRRGGE